MHTFIICTFATVNENRLYLFEPLSRDFINFFWWLKGGLLNYKKMTKINCPQCGNQIFGILKYERDEHGKLYQVIDYTCSCGCGWIYNPNIHTPS